MNTDEIELKLLVEALRLRYGYDFTDYVETSLRRRMTALMTKAKAANFSELQGRLLHDENFFNQSLQDFTVGTSAMFRDPDFFRHLREEVIPVLRTYPNLKIWHAGCSTGEEVYSLAILLKEEGLYDRAVIYATDINSTALLSAKKGIYSTEAIKAATGFYHAAGGTAEYSKYYSALYDAVRMDPSLSENVVFAEHNLVTDEVFSEMHLILCRNVFIYFNRELQSRVLKLFARSLCYKGFLCLGNKESIQFLECAASFSSFIDTQKIYRKTTTSSGIGAGSGTINEGPRS